MIEQFLILALVFQVKHFLCDYPLQTPYMLRKFLPTWRGYAKPLAAHAGVHAVFTFGIALAYGYSDIPFGVVWVTAGIDFIVHFTQDRIKASPKLLGRYKALSGAEYMLAKRIVTVKASGWKHSERSIKENTYFWWALGQDQLVHHCTHYLIIYLLLTSIGG